MHQPISLLYFRGPVLLKSPLFLLRGSAKPFAVVNEIPFRNRMHPLHARTVARYEARQTQLNLYVVVGVATHKSNCVRDRIRRRISEATRLALAEFGYREDGSALPVANRMKEGGRGGIVGTLVYHPVYKVVSAPWEELMAEVKRGVDKFMVLKERDAKNAEMEMEAMLDARDARRASVADKMPLASAAARERISSLKARDEQDMNARLSPKVEGTRSFVGDRRGGGVAELQWRPAQSSHGGDRRIPSQYQQSSYGGDRGGPSQDRQSSQGGDRRGPSQDRQSTYGGDRRGPSQDQQRTHGGDRRGPSQDQQRTPGGDRRGPSQDQQSTHGDDRRGPSQYQQRTPGGDRRGSSQDRQSTYVGDRRSPSQDQQRTYSGDRRGPSQDQQSTPDHQQQRQPPNRDAPTWQDRPRKDNPTEMAPRQTDRPLAWRPATPSWMSRGRGGVV